MGAESIPPTLDDQYNPRSSLPQLHAYVQIQVRAAGREVYLFCQVDGDAVGKTKTLGNCAT